MTQQIINNAPPLHEEIDAGVRGNARVTDTDIKFLVGTLPDGRVLLDFRLAKVDHLKLTREQALELAEGLVDAARQAAQHGRLIETGFVG